MKGKGFTQVSRDDRDDRDGWRCSMTSLSRRSRPFVCEACALETELSDEDVEEREGWQIVLHSTLAGIVPCVATLTSAVTALLWHGWDNVLVALFFLLFAALFTGFYAVVGGWMFFSQMRLADLPHSRPYIFASNPLPQRRVHQTRGRWEDGRCCHSGSPASRRREM